MEKMGFPKSRGWLLTLLLAMAIWVAGPAIADAQFRSKPQGRTQTPSSPAGQASPPAPQAPARATAPGSDPVQGQAAAQPPAPSPGPATAPAQPPARQLGKPAPPASGGEANERYISIDFNNVDINVFIKFISELTGKNFVVDDQVKGKVTVISPSKISIAEAYKVFESVLEVHGFTAVPAGEITKIVPSPEAREKNIETRLLQEAATPEDRVVTQLIPLKFADANEIKTLMAPLISKSSVMLAYPQTNTLIVTDVYSNILRLMRIFDAIDVTGIGREISIIPLAHADAEKMVKILLDIFIDKKKQTKKADVESEIKAVADKRTNVVILMATEDDTLRMKSLITMLDKEVPPGEDKIRVYYLKNATAEDMAKVLESLSSKSGGGTTTTEGKKEAPVVSDKVKITADKATNSLVVQADKEDYRILEEIIQKLDIPRSMVYIEALIMEVSIEDGLSLGVDWNVFGSTNVGSDGRQGAVGGGFSKGVLSSGSLAPGSSTTSGFSMGILSQPVTIAGATVSNLAAIAKAAKTNTNANILSTPQLLTTDNEEASITVGQNLPFQTRATATTTGTTTTDTGGSAYFSYEYKDVGKILKITPHISEDRRVRLKISLEVTDVVSAANDRPTTSKRTVETTVIVDDGATVVLGGLIDDKIGKTDAGVPCLGRIPGAGWLFKTVSDTKTKNNLYVFLSPKVVKSPAEAENVTRDKKTAIEEKVNEGRIKLYEKGTANQ